MTDVLIKINSHSDKVWAGNAKIGKRQVDQNLPGLGLNVSDQEIGDDYEHGTKHGEAAYCAYSGPQRGVLVEEWPIHQAGVEKENCFVVWAAGCMSEMDRGVLAFFSYFWSCDTWQVLLVEVVQCKG